MSHSLQRLVLGVLLLLALLSTVQAVRNATVRPGASRDFQWDAARLLLDRQNPYKIALANERADTDRFMPDRVEPNQLPSFLILLWPYAIFPWAIAKHLWLFSNLLFTGMLLWITLRTFLPRRSLYIYLVISCLVVIGTPWRSIVGLGQHILFSLSFFVLALWYAGKSRQFIAGLLLACSLFKYSTVIPLMLYFLYKRHYKSLAIALGTHLLLHLFAAYWLQENPYDLVQQAVAASSRLVNAGYLDIFALTNQLRIDPPLALPISLSGILLLVSTWLCIFRRDGNDLLVLSMLAFVSTVLVYHRTYDYLVLLFPLVILFQPHQERTVKILFLICIGLTWYLDRAVFALLPRARELNLEPTIYVYYYSSVAIWYSTLFYTFFRIGKRSTSTHISG